MNQTQVLMVEVGAGQEDQRLDNFLLSYLKGVPKSLVYRIVRRGEVRINGGRAKPHTRLTAGDKVRIPPLRWEIKEKQPPGDAALQRVAAALIHEDRNYLVLNKPAGMAVHGGSGISYGVIEALRALRPQAPLLALAHRLDRDTSGCLLVAKKRSALREFQQLLRQGEVHKQYLTLLRGQCEPDWTTDVPLKKNVLSSGERIVRVNFDGGKEARTRFHVQRQYSHAALVEVTLETGRTHQIRVHSAHSGHVIAGDEKYGDSGFNVRMREQGLKRLFLHARQLQFRLENGADYCFTAALPADLKQVLKCIE